MLYFERYYKDKVDIGGTLYYVGEELATEWNRESWRRNYHHRKRKHRKTDGCQWD